LENTTDVILVDLEDEDPKWTNGLEAKIVDLAELVRANENKVSEPDIKLFRLRKKK